MATGVLPLVLGRATRLAQFFSAGEKTYDAHIQFGWSTDTYDREGERTSEPVEPRFTRAELETVTGADSAVRFCKRLRHFRPRRVAGTPAYRLARKGTPVDLPPVQVQVFALDLLEFDGATARIRLRCSAGTYLRGIAHDVGRELGCGAFLTALRRTASSEFTEGQAFTLEALGDLARAGTLRDGSDSRRLACCPSFRTRSVDTVTAGQIRHGKDFRLSPFVEWSGVEVREGRQSRGRSDCYWGGAPAACISSDSGAVRARTSNEASLISVPAEVGL